MRGAWYCGPACFIRAATTALSLLMRPEMGTEKHIERMPLGLMLMSKGILTKVQLRESTDELRQSGGEMGELLVRRGSVSEKQVAAIRALQWGCPVFAMPTYLAPTEVQIPSILIQRHSAVPVYLCPAKNLLLVGFTDAIDYGLLYAIEQMTGYKTQPCFVTPRDFQSQIEREGDIRGGHDNTTLGEVMFEEFQSAEEIADVLCKYGIDLEAEEVILERCGEHLWVRLVYGFKKCDLLFRAT